MTDRLKLTPIVDGSTSSVMTCLTTSKVTLIGLIGEQATEGALAALGLSPSPKVVIRNIPLNVSALLDQAFPQNMSGMARRLFCQARLLEYLGGLIDYLGIKDEGDAAPVSQRAQKLHEHLMAAEGKLPKLDELANQFGCSARTLNNEFKQVYGQSICAFINDHRLNEAHAAVQKSETPIKVLAERLGYNHTNHFLAAFRKKFGYPPGQLRKGKQAP